MTYSIDFRKQVLRSISNGMTVRDAAQLYNISTSTIHSWTQTLVPKKNRNKAPTKIANEALLQDVKQYPDDYMYERAQRFGCSKSGIESALKRLGISKKKTLKHPKSCPVKRAEYLRRLNDYIAQGYPIVYMDESGFEAETIRPHGYAPIGEPCIDSYNWQAKKRTNVIGALYGKMLFALEYVYKNVNWEVMYDWCKHTLIPSLKTQCVIVMDNASFHKKSRIQKLLNRHGHRILWLPPYSPDLNPIEKKWAHAKFLRQGWMENDLDKLFNDMHYSSFIVD
ncbi:IS630 family transposase [Psychrobacter frigidicola]|uniref:IS630 family transposase n=1 Tax=Psychrobacter frigidicola TaxID=45611 RepID=UPI00191A123E|nr:IS630 family transposase [Psychrobacter frigidicola]